MKETLEVYKHEWDKEKFVFHFSHCNTFKRLYTGYLKQFKSVWRKYNVLLQMYIFTRDFYKSKYM